MFERLITQYSLWKKELLVLKQKQTRVILVEFTHFLNTFFEILYKLFSPAFKFLYLIQTISIAHTGNGIPYTFIFVSYKLAVVKIKFTASETEDNTVGKPIVRINSKEF
jgi:hypothetical protein